MDKALVIQGARFGDIIQTKRLVLSLKDQFEVHLACDKNLATLARLIYPFCEIHGINLHGGNQETEVFKFNEGAFKTLKSANFSRIYNCNFSVLTAALCRLFPEKHVISYRPAHTSTGGILRSEWARLIFRLSASRNTNPLNLVDCWGFMAENPVVPCEVNPPATAGGGGIGIVASGREARRSLQASTIAQIASIAYRLLKADSIKLFGVDSQADTARKIIHFLSPEIKNKTANLVGKTAWPELVREMTGLDLLLTPDTGAMHLAAHLGVPVMAFFLSSAWCHETAPYGKGHIIWQIEETCSPCLESRACEYKEKCKKPFQDENFGRFLAAILAKRTVKNFPENLQCWETGFDNLGARLFLKDGEDRLQNQRLLNRSILGNYLHFSDFTNLENNFSPDKVAAFTDNLFPESEWMLPPWRYD